MDYFARTRPRPDGSREPCQPLADHLRGVADLAEGFAREARPGDGAFAEAARVAGLLHDLGKYRREFQDAMLAGADTPPHAPYGASAAYTRFEAQGVAFAVAAHHAGLHDESGLNDMVAGPRWSADARFPALLETAVADGVVWPPYRGAEDPPQHDPVACRKFDLETRMLLSALVDADRTHAAGNSGVQARLIDPKAMLEALREAVATRARYAAARRPANGQVLEQRSRVFDAAVKQGAASERGFFTLTVPTGGGKTLASMGFALAHALRHNDPERGLRRIIVVLPYLTIIEQNARVYRDIFGDQRVLEHHSGVGETRPAKAAARADADEGDPPFSELPETAVENWNAPVIVTTSVQFIESLFARSASRCRKLHNVARSIVIFDEVQTLPTHLLDPLLDVLRGLVLAWGVSVVMCTATQPAFRKSSSLRCGFVPEAEVREIAPEPTNLFRMLQRVRYSDSTREAPWTWDRLTAELAAHRQALCILNIRRHAREVWELLRSAVKGRYGEHAMGAVIHLSSAMCAQHRLDCLGPANRPPDAPLTIRERLDGGQPCWVVSTQVVEAGVDIDFPAVYRALGPLDSIAQAGGRCNREGSLTDADGSPRLGEVVVFVPEDNGLPRGSIYQQATGITPRHLDPDRLATDPDLFAHYFGELHCLAPTDHAKCGENTIQEDRARLKFKTVSERAKVIRDETIPIVVPYVPAAPLITCVLRRIRLRGMPRLEDYRALQRFIVNVRRDTFDELQAAGGLDPDPFLARMRLHIALPHCYDPWIGLHVGRRSPEDFIA